MCRKWLISPPRAVGIRTHRSRSVRHRTRTPRHTGRCRGYSGTQGRFVRSSSPLFLLPHQSKNGLGQLVTAHVGTAVSQHPRFYAVQALLCNLYILRVQLCPDEVASVLQGYDSHCSRASERIKNGVALCASCQHTRLNQCFRHYGCLLYTSPSPRDRQKSRMPSSA